MKIDTFLLYDGIKSKRSIISRFDIKEGYMDPECYFEDLKCKINIIKPNGLKNISKQWFKLFYTTNICQDLIETLYTISYTHQLYDYVCFNHQIELGYKLFKDYKGNNDNMPIRSRYRNGYAIPIINFNDIFKYSSKLK